MSSIYGVLNKAFENVAESQLFLFPYWSANPGAATPAAYAQACLALLFGADTTYKTLQGASGGTASVATTGVMTLTAAPTTGSVAVGQAISMTGLPAGTTIQSLLTGTINTANSTYQLSLPPATSISAESFTTQILPWGDVDENGFQFKVDVDKIQFPHADGSAPGEVNGMTKDAGVDFAIYDVDANHIADIFGLTGNDVFSVASSPTSSAIVGANLSSPSSAQKFISILKTPSPLVPGYFDFVILYRVNFVGGIDVKMTAKERLSMKGRLACNSDLYLMGTTNGIASMGCRITTTGPHS